MYRIAGNFRRVQIYQRKFFWGVVWFTYSARMRGHAWLFLGLRCDLASSFKFQSTWDFHTPLRKVMRISPWSRDITSRLAEVQRANARYLSGKMAHNRSSFLAQPQRNDQNGCWVPADMAILPPVRQPRYLCR